ncbi:MAG: DUF84 domain-containing protein [Pyrinomonas sp.]|uniref:inosine/xanthosine triphosphatase n=1 Tax=Pyrinomonas sp. TaxID=2080306 RepID=UPI00332CB4F4
MKIALGSNRPAKVAALEACVERLAGLDSQWGAAEIIARPVTTTAPAMPLTDEQTMRGARERALAIRQILAREGLQADLFVGLEGGFHTERLWPERITFLRNWAYVTDGTRGAFGAGPSIQVPPRIAACVIEQARELGEVIDEIAGEQDVRSRQGAWGVLSRNLITRAMSFEMALIAALAPFYNGELYRD